jgi:hypothetical protein
VPYSQRFVYIEKSWIELERREEIKRLGELEQITEWFEDTINNSYKASAVIPKGKQG